MRKRKLLKLLCIIFGVYIHKFLQGLLLRVQLLILRVYFQIYYIINSFTRHLFKYQRAVIRIIYLLVNIIVCNSVLQSFNLHFTDYQQIHRIYISYMLIPHITLNIFSCTCWLYICLPWKISILGLCSFLTQKVCLAFFPCY